MKFEPIRRIVKGYQIKSQRNGLYKIVEYSAVANKDYKKKTIQKNLGYSDAEEKVYTLEKKLRK